MSLANKISASQTHSWYIFQIVSISVILVMKFLPVWYLVCVISMNHPANPALAMKTSLFKGPVRPKIKTLAKFITQLICHSSPLASFCQWSNVNGQPDVLAGFVAL